jgi:hypothetical protein
MPRLPTEGCIMLRKRANLLKEQRILAQLSRTTGTLDLSMHEYNQYGQDGCDNGVRISSVRQTLI